MSVFNDYSKYYDLLYRDKDYKTEVKYIDSLIRRLNLGANSILNLGCGTGSHDILFGERGYDVKGVDFSKDMLALANRKLVNYPFQNRVTFFEGDARKIRINKQFDVVISLFHVMSYQTENEDINQIFKTANLHLKEGGIFIFDCWYGPGVLSDPPVVRHKILEDESLRIHRIANPVLHVQKNVVDVNYTILVQNKRDQVSYEISETHKMRYLFVPEVKLFSSINGFTSKYLRSNIFSNKWKALFVCRK